MTRGRRRSVYLFALCALGAFVLFLGLRALYLAATGDDDAVSSTRVDDSIIALKDGSTMVAERGTLGREMADWVERNTKGQATFLLAGEHFSRGSAAPASESWPRFSRLALLLNANSDLTAHILVFARDTGDPQADLRLAGARAQRVHRELIARVVPASRLTAEGRLAPAAAGSGMAIQNDRIAVTLSKGVGG